MEEDFIVEEIIKLKRSNGKYLYVKLVKKSWNTIDVIDSISKRLGINKKNIGYAGLKDKNAITTQYISLLNVNIEQINKIKIKDVSLEPLFYGDRAIRLGDLTGNKFKIKVDFKPKKIDFCENYFGEQRFGGNNFEVGKALLKEDFKTALELIGIKYENKDYMKYLRKIDRRLLSLYVNSVQSYFWNKVVCEYIKKNYKYYKEKDELVFVDKIKDNFSIPLIGFDVEFKDKFVEKTYLELLNEEGLKIEDYVMRKLHEIMPISVERNVFIKIKNFKYNKDYISFELPKGSYATTVLKKLESFLSS
ncbi:MAG: tRNA pseudouridine(13) synthase TruD [Nanoarchaeota archaeon]|nr:tRNA pseudouridine(13) synthase TruD [Nanoarchaeota archaeon]